MHVYQPAAECCGNPVESGHYHKCCFEQEWRLCSLCWATANSPEMVTVKING